jgi:fructosamine-3-kinase
MLAPETQNWLTQVGGSFRLKPVAGGDISEAFKVRFDDGSVAFLKGHDDPPANLFRGEAEGLRALADAGAPVPAVLGVHPQAILLEWLELGPGPAGAEAGEMLARLHRMPVAGFGGQPDNYLGTLVQSQPVCGSWLELYRDRRLRPLAKGTPRPLRRAIDQLLPRLESLLDLPDPASPVHGDLWAGNLGATDRGAVLFDPAFYTGHREVDLAMALLFGGFDTSFFAAYENVYPRTKEWRSRVALHQIYPVLAHYHLFGAPYDRNALRLIEPYL